MRIDHVSNPWGISVWIAAQFTVLTTLIVRKNWFIFIVDTITNVPIFPLFTHLHPAPAPPSLWPSPHWCLCLFVMHMCSSADPFTFFHPVPLPPSPLTAVCLFHVSTPLFLICSSVYFVHQIPHVSEIIWYLSFSDWLISLSIIHLFIKDR